MESQSKRGCIICGKKGALNRGLCSTHHSRYYKEVRELSEEQKAIYNETLIKRGLLLPPQKRGPKTDDNAFAVIAEELFAAESKSVYTKLDASAGSDQSALELKASQSKQRSTKSGPKEEVRASRKKKS